MIKDNLNNEKENNPELESQRIFEEGMPESAESQAFPSSLDDLSDEDQLDVAPDWNPEESAARSERADNDAQRNSGNGSQVQKPSFIDGKLSSEAHSHIKGWGIDADPSNDPTYPIKNRTNEEQLGNTWERPTLQEVHTEVLVSNERNNFPAIHSSENPPKGLSGMLKRKAFKYSESDYNHWLLLIASDKIGVLEGKLDDLRHGHIPNPIAERGLKAEWKYNRGEFVKKTAIKAAVIGAAAGLILLSRGRKKQKSGLLENLRNAI